MRKKTPTRISIEPKKFISISIDKNKNNWKTYIAKHDMNWEQYNIPNDGICKFLDDFAINGIPRFMLIGKGGKVTDQNVDCLSTLINKCL